ncbi:VOC family protein [Actinomadura spongiicola]|uniref:VOC family protein n=1 Tax=Actinomadura spongiicola TaxID=2303421 RepID=A0A372GHD7_9ACTN|nr:VOC family protein [Actinomadura spongiicola]RFS84795.1 VOC family protein [Actinomadura spongiicola]
MYINHVALPVDEVDRASDFYVDWFGARVIPSPRFPVPVAWLLLGKVQVHLVRHPGPTSPAYHFAVAVEDTAAFEALYRRADREGRLDRETFPHHIYELPRGDVQMWMRDSDDNIIEVDHPSAAVLSAGIASVLKRWADDKEQGPWNRRASLFMPEQAGLALEA